MTKAAVLMLGERAIAPSWLSQRLQRNECACWSAKSAEDAIALFKEHNFQIVVNTGAIGEAIRILPHLEGSTCSVFSACLVENGCWWLPLMHTGQECLGASAMRTVEFVRLLDERLQGIRTGEIEIAVRLNEGEEIYALHSH
jgi:hypothetical protein